jgi:hypothetical protein
VIPHPYVGLVLALGVFRIVRLIGWDTFPLALKLRRRATGETIYRNATEKRDGDIIRYDRPTLEHFLTCPWCVGFYACVVAYVAWRFEPFWTVTVLAPFALNAVVGLVAKQLDP